MSTAAVHRKLVVKQANAQLLTRLARGTESNRSTGCAERGKSNAAV